MISHIILVYISSFFALFSLKNELHYTFMMLKLINLFKTHRQKQTKLSLLLPITIIFFFLKFGVSGVSAQGLAFLFSSKLLLRIMVFIGIYLWKMGKIHEIKLLASIDRILDNKETKTIISSGLNSFDIGAVYNISITHLYCANPSYLNFVLWTMIFGFSAFLNRYLTVFMPEKWEKNHCLGELKTYIIPHVSITAWCLITPKEITLNYLLSFALIFCFSFNNIWKAEKKIIIEIPKKKLRDSPMEKIKEQKKTYIENGKTRKRLQL